MLEGIKKIIGLGSEKEVLDDLEVTTIKVEDPIEVPYESPIEDRWIINQDYRDVIISDYEDIITQKNFRIKNLEDIIKNLKDKIKTLYK